jgi:hypothetical protein
VNTSVLHEFHASHATAPDAYSPCMHRSDAETVSFSRIQVTDSDIAFFYSPGPPCQGCPGEIRKMARL